MALHSTRLVGAALGALLLAPWAVFAQSPAAPAAADGKGKPGYLRVQAGQLGGAYGHGPAQQVANPYLKNPSGRRPGVVPTQAQTTPGAPAQPPRGRVRIQGRDQPEPEVPILAPDTVQPDTRQQMRRFIQSITTFARRHNRNFAVIPKGGLELLIKRDAVEETRFGPSRTFMRSIDGVMIDGLYFDDQVFGEPPPSERQAAMLKLADIAQNNGLKVFVVDYGSDRNTVDVSRRRNREKGFVSTTVPAPLAELIRLPPYPARPFDENPLNILSLKDVSNFAYIGDSSSFGRQDEFAMQMHGNNFDLLIIDNFHGREPLSRQAVETLKYKHLGARRLVYARVNIGIAASYKYYWKPTWREGSPLWIKAPLREDPDRYYVEFWRPEWQRIIAGDTQSFVYGLIAQGFDGVILEGIEEAYRFFEGGEEQLLPGERPATAARQTPQGGRTEPPVIPPAPAAPAPAPAPGQPTPPQ